MSRETILSGCCLSVDRRKQFFFLHPSNLSVFWVCVLFAIRLSLGRVLLKLWQYGMQKKSYDIEAVNEAVTYCLGLSTLFFLSYDSQKVKIQKSGWKCKTRDSFQIVVLRLS